MPSAQFNRQVCNVDSCFLLCRTVLSESVMSCGCYQSAHILEWELFCCCLQYSACFSVLWCVFLYYGVLRYNALSCSLLYSSFQGINGLVCFSLLLRFVIHCPLLFRPAVFCTSGYFSTAHKRMFCIVLFGTMLSCCLVYSSLEHPHINGRV